MAKTKPDISQRGPLKKGGSPKKEAPILTRAPGGGAVAVVLGGKGDTGVHPGSRDTGYRGKVHWNVEKDGLAFLVKPPGGETKIKLEFCKELPVSGEFDIATSGGAGVTRDP